MKFLDLFSGIGGFRLALESLGHQSVGFCEIDKFARSSYKAIYNTEGENEWHDITKVTDEEFKQLRGKTDIICGGFPCQAFSIAGKRGGFEDTRGTLFFQIARAAKQIQPRYLLLENVKGLLSHNKGETFGTIINTLDELGYDVEWQVLNSKNYGVPQNRERVFIVGHLRGSSGRKIFPISATNGTFNVSVKVLAHRNGYRRNTQVFSPDGITETLDTGQGGGRGHYTITMNRKEIKGVTNVSHCLMARDYKGIGNQDMAAVVVPVHKPDHHGVAIKEATKQGYDTAYPGDSINYSVPNSETRRGRVGKNIANTLDTGCQQGVLTEEYRIRKLTPRECWRLQAFPDWAFNKAAEVNSNSQLYKQAGNSVTVSVVRAVAENFIEV